MVDVFISYSRTDHPMVALLARAVEAEGYDVWWDADLPPHQSYGDVITAKIGAAKAAIVVWSGDAVKSEWVRAEADMARNQKKLVQTALDRVMPPLPFNQIQFAEIGDWRGEPDHPGWRKVKASLAELCGKPLEPVSEARRYAVPPAPPPVIPAASAPKWPLYAGIGVAAVAVAALVGTMLMKDGKPDAAAVSGRTELPATQDIGELPNSRFDIFATVRDPDGFVNVRDAPSTSGAVLAKANVGAPLRTFSQSADWWIVRMADGKTGYVARSRLVLPEEGIAPAKAAVVAGPSPAAPAETQTVNPAPATGAPRVFFPDSSVRRLDEGEFAGLSAPQLRLARNEIFARNGRRFRDAELTAYFSRFPWYQPTGFEVALTPLEQANVALLTRAEAAARR